MICKLSISNVACSIKNIAAICVSRINILSEYIPVFLKSYYVVLVWRLKHVR